jgi:threonylcarbamoyladenosine tRNA methylthiotransferase MtaB
MPPTKPLERRIGFHTFGCKLNQYETEALASAFRGQGFSIVSSDEDAEAYVINTCTVTARADHKARALVRGLARGRPGALLVVTGCSAQLEAAALSALSPNVIVVPQARKAWLLDLPRALAADPARPAAALAAGAAGAPTEAAAGPFAFTVDEYSFHTRAFLKIQDGCDAACAYCRVPQARGPSVSLDAPEVVRRAAALESMGNREIVITGIHVSAYRAGDIRLADLLRLLLDATSRTRFRLSSLEPESVTEGLAGALAHPRVCAHFHLPVQSGSDRILAAMKRRYRADRVREAVALLRSVKSDPFIAADVIAGFPGETDEDHAATRECVQSLAFSALHVFPFSPRPGTAAFGMKPAVPERTRYQRARELTGIARAQSLAYARSWIGREVEALIEDRVGAKTHGVSGNYLKLDIHGLPAGAEPAGRLARVTVTAVHSRCAAEFAGFSD